MHEARKGSPVIWSEGVTVEVGAIHEETCSLDHVLCYHTQAVQNIEQLAKTEREKLEMPFNLLQNESFKKKNRQILHKSPTAPPVGRGPKVKRAHVCSLGSAQLRS